MLSVAEVSAQVLSAAERDSISAVLSRMIEREVPRTRTNVRSVRYRRGCLTIETTVTLSYYPFRVENVRAIRCGAFCRPGTAGQVSNCAAAAAVSRITYLRHSAVRPTVRDVLRTVLRGLWLNHCRVSAGRPKDWPDAILPFGRVTDGISTRRRIYGAGSVRRCGRRARISFRRVS